MSYLGKVALKASDIRRLDVTSSTSATHTLTWTPPNEQSLIITINGVKQQNNYSISGVTLTLDTALISTDAMEVIGINDIGTTTVPGDGTVTTAKIEDDAVTADKLANSINTEIAANTAKVTNATHTGDVTGATALTIAAGAVDLPMLSATGTASATTYLRGDNAWSAISAGGSNAPAFHINKSTTDQTIADDTLTKVSFNTTILDTDSGVDLANDKYVVPSGEGGKYFIYAFCNLYPNSSGAFKEGNLDVRVNGATIIRSQITPSTGNAGSIDVSGIVALAAADYVEMFIHSNVSSSDSNVYAGTGHYTFMGAFKLDGIA